MPRYLTVCQPVIKPGGQARMSRRIGTLEGTKVGIQGGNRARVESGTDNYAAFLRTIETQLREEHGVIDAHWWTDTHSRGGYAGTLTHSDDYVREVSEFVEKVDWAICGVGV